MARILVIGGGISGLSAALLCQQSGHHVTLLEARQRLGGRIFTQHLNGFPVEFGASFWEGHTHHPFYEHYLKTRTHLFDPNALQLYTLRERANGVLEDMQHHLPLYRLAQHLLEQHLEKKATKHHSYAQAIAALSQHAACDYQSYWCQKWMEYELKHHDTPLSDVGVPSFDMPTDPLLLESWNSLEANFCMIKGGFDNVIQALRQRCLEAGVTLHLNSPVEHIDNSHKSVAVLTRTQCFHADSVISTIPIGVLKKKASSLFKRLSFQKRMALNAIGVHQGQRFILRFNTCFWENEASPHILLNIPSRSGFIEFRNTMALHGEAILQTDSYTHPQGIESIMADLRRAYPKAPYPTNHYVYSWSDDPFSRGTYPYRTIHQNESLQQALESQEGNVYFTGADFSRLGFSCHHGVVQAQQCAKRVCQSL